MTSPNEPPESFDPETEARVRRALCARAGETVVSPDALGRIRRRSTTSRWARPTAYAAVAAAIAVIVGVGISTQADDGASPVDTADPRDVTTTTGGPAADDPPPDLDDGDAPVDDVENLRSADLDASSSREPLSVDPAEAARAGLVIWPLDGRTFPDGLAAATDWAVEVLGVTDPLLEPATLALESGAVGSDVEVHGLRGQTEGGGPGRVMTRVVTASADGGDTWVVTHALADEIGVTLVEENTAESLRVTGTGRAFEGTAYLIVDDSQPRHLLSVGGGGEFSEFSVVVPAPDSFPTILRVEGSLGVEGGIPDVTSFAAIPAPRSSELTVFGVADDDVLNVRAGPGVAYDIVATLPPDARGIIHTGGVERPPDGEWWAIEADGVLGWVDRSFLSVQHTDAAVPGLGDRLLSSTAAALENLAPSAMAPKVEIGGIGVYADLPTPWTTIDRDELSAVHTWSPADIVDDVDLVEMTTAEFLGIDSARWSDAEYTVGVGLDDPNPGYSYMTGLTEDFYDRFTTVTAYIPVQDPQQALLDWRRYTVVWEFDDGRPQIRGIWRWGWTP